LQAAEMVLIRLTHAADLPTPADLVRQLQDGGGVPAGRQRRSPAPEPPSPSTTALVVAPTAPARSEPTDRPRAFAGGGGVAAVQAEPAALAPNPESFADIVTLLGERREAILQAHLKNNVHLVHFESGRIEFRPDEHAPRNLANRLGALLSEWTGRRWVVAISSEPGEPTLAQQESAADRRERAEVTAHPLVQAAMAAFPGATIEAIRDLSVAVEPPLDGEPEA
jgi:DNA polymerase III subunit gamma/tau